ncbi:MAG TPA: helix-turn-helix domain-containing protein [Terriglobia bacterium]|nr:helix-turn-helix domain-containing protein [Terriglobia bacterium]
MVRLKAFEDGSPEIPTYQTLPVSERYPARCELEALLTSKEASQILKIHPKVLERMAKRGEVPALKVGEFWRYRATTLDAWINSRLQSVANRAACKLHSEWRRHAGTIPVRKFNAPKAEERATRLAIPLDGEWEFEISADRNYRKTPDS